MHYSVVTLSSGGATVRLGSLSRAAEELFPGRDSAAIEELHPYTYIATDEDNLRRHFSRDSFSEVIAPRSSDHGAVLSMIGQKNRRLGCCPPLQ